MIPRFVELVREYLALIDGLPGLTARDFLLRCAILLPQIYSLSQQLPEVDLPDDDPLEGKDVTIEPPMGKIKIALGKHDVYSAVFDPVCDKEAITSTISDDLSDIPPVQPLRGWPTNFSLSFGAGLKKIVQQAVSLSSSLRDMRLLVFQQPGSGDKFGALVGQGGCVQCLFRSRRGPG